MKNSLSLSISVFSTLAIVLISVMATFMTSHILSGSSWLAPPDNIMVKISRLVSAGVVVFCVLLILLGRIMLEFTSARPTFNLAGEFSQLYSDSKPVGQQASWIGTSTCFTILIAILRERMFPQQTASLFLPISDKLVFVFVLAIIGPIAEETFFRGWIWKIYSLYMSNRNAGIAVTLLWLIAHAAFDFPSLPFLGALGLILYLNRLNQGTILTTSLIHISYNLFVVLTKMQ